jgi:hypothetical protein
VGTAGYFTVLKPNTWFPASRLPGSSRYRPGQSKEAEATARASASAPEQQVPAPSVIRETTAPSLLMKWRTLDHPLMRPLLIVLAAAAITAGLLLLIQWAP